MDRLDRDPVAILGWDGCDGIERGRDCHRADVARKNGGVMDLPSERDFWFCTHGSRFDDPDLITQWRSLNC